ncbi:hypothetical protein NESM_000473600 [Novymonas esmeraldas]|uniref:Uncharacterized protein n=1 Tax=Novymonas esmeraldas TaxID=1808958 RepID=A0AAW0EMS0_9TRYP
MAERSSAPHTGEAPPPPHPTHIGGDIESFRPADLPLLSFIALGAAQCVSSRSAEIVLDAVLSPPSAPSAPGDSDSDAENLVSRYPEVRVVFHLHCLRCALRDLQECPAHARRTFFSIVQEHVAALATVLPDPLFTAIAAVLEGLLASVSDDSLAKGHCHVLEVQLMKIVEATQLELLCATKQLRVRAGELTLRFHHSIPYL